MSKGAIGVLAAYWPEGTARHAHVPLERVTQSCVRQPASTSPDAVALATGDRTLRYGEVVARMERAVEALSASAGGVARVAVLLDDPVEEIVWTLAAMDLDLLAWTPGPRPETAALAAFEPDLVISDDPPEGYRVMGSGELSVVDAALQGSKQGSVGRDSPKRGTRPNLRAPIAALARSSGGEVLHSHKTLLATAISLSSFYLLEPGAQVLLLEPPGTWIGLAMFLATWYRSGTVHSAWHHDKPAVTGKFDYVVETWDGHSGLLATPLTAGVRVGVGMVAGVSGPFDVSIRRRLARRIGAPVLTVLGSNEHGPYLASHPSWYLNGSPGIPLPNVDIRPLDPAGGRELSIGWDAVEEAELGLKSSLSPAGGESVGSWLRTHLVGHVDPTGLYFLRRQVS